jgi:NAD(P) transhydrogenase subunit beta
VPQRTALSHAFGGLAAALVGVAEYISYQSHLEEVPRFVFGALALEMLLGFLTFTGSLMAFGKLQEIVSTRPIVYPGRNFVSIGTLITSVIAAIWLVVEPDSTVAFAVLIGAALLFGVRTCRP